MNFIYTHIPILKNNQNLLTSLDSAARRLSEELNALDLDKLAISQYNKMYLKRIIKKSRHYLQVHTYILAYAFNGLEIPCEQIVFIDHGGGTGILSLLAKELGVGTGNI